ncbi:MAG: fluoride efflux transporter CrcB [Planctomycetota bacterium]
MNWVLVGLGGLLGSLSRYGVSLLLQRVTDSTNYPLGILTVNVVGCFVGGLVLARSDVDAGLSPELKLFLVVGFLGGFTTFSALGMDTHSILQDGQLAKALLNVVLNVVVGTAAVWAGFQLAAPARGG